MASFPTPGQSTFTAPEEQAMRADARQRRQQLRGVELDMDIHNRPLPKEFQDQNADEENNMLRQSREKAI